MSGVVYLLLGLFVAVLAFGLTGQYGVDAGGVIDVSLISVWLFIWLGDRGSALRFAVTLGIMFDILSYTFFGYWLFVFTGLVFIIDWLKTGFLTVSSFSQAMLVLAAVTIITHLLTSVMLSNYNYIEILTSTLFNVLVGAVLYYLFTTKLKMFQRWSGRRL